MDFDINVIDKASGNLGKGIKPDEVSVTFDYLAEGLDKFPIAQGQNP